MLVGVLGTPLPVARIAPPPPLHTTIFLCIVLVMPVSRDTLTELDMTLVGLIGAKSLWDPVVSQLLGEWVASSPLARARWSEATEVGYLPYSRQAKGGGEAICLPPLPGPGPHRPPHGLERPQARLPARVGVHELPGVGLHGRNGPPVPRPIPTRDTFTDTWKQLVTPLDLRPPVSVPDPPASGRSWPLPSLARYVQSCPSLADTIDWTRPLTFIVRGDAYPCAGGS